ncbi:putative mitochondrial protein [Vitis vinifera]|uniref:Putative mitochondrial protein n=2 Tax=Vitis vinifera TaxID=29760 RepID=A0A438ECH7_VITVI|nr:putative mitochondrial protein [Vitis vinifera]
MGENGVICKLDIEKAYDSINWQFLLKVMEKMGFGSKWLRWMWWCISIAKFSVMVNGTPAGFFSSSKGLWQGDPLSPYLFVMGMEVLSILIRRAMEGGFISGCKIQRDRGRAVHVAHLLFADDTIVFCEAKKEYLTNLSWILYWFEAASGLRIHLAKSEIIPVREVEEVEELAVELGCRVGHLPTVYLGLPLGVPNKAVYGWDGVEEKQVLVAKYGQEDYGWRTKKVVGACGVGVWKEILKEAGWCWDNLVFKVGKGNKIRFWNDMWCGDSALSQRFPHLYILAAHRNALVEDMRDQNAGEGSWNLRFIRDFNDWEVEMVGELL